MHHGDRRQPVRDPDQLLPRALGAQPAGRHGGQEEEVVPRRSRGEGARSSSSIPRRTPDDRRSPSRSRARTTCCTWTSSPAPTSRSSTACSPTWSNKGWQDKDFIAQYTQRISTRRSQANKLSLDEASRITGVPVAKLRQAAEWAYKPKAAGHAPRTMHAYEKGIIWGNDNYLIQSALVDLVLATHNVGRRGTGVRADGRPPGGLHAAALPRRQARSTSTRRSSRARADVHCVGRQSVPDHAQRRAAPRGDPAPRQHRARRRWARRAAPRPSRWSTSSTMR